MQRNGTRDDGHRALTSILGPSARRAITASRYQYTRKPINTQTLAETLLMGHLDRHCREETPLPENPAADQLLPLPTRALQDTASVFGLLSSTVRVHLLWLLAGGGQDVSTLAEATGQTVATVSHHLGKLKLARIVEVHRRGKHHIYVIAEPRVLDVVRLAIQPHLQATRQTSRRNAHYV